MDAIVVTEAPVLPSGSDLNLHLNDPNWGDNDTQTPGTADISLESHSYASRSIDKIDAASISAPSSKDYDFDECGISPPCSRTNSLSARL